MCQTGAADPATHKIYIWDISNDGQFATALDGGREPLVHLHVTWYFPFPVAESNKTSIVAPKKIINCIYHESGQYTYLALS